ncbi:MAG: family 10 glycosylhydrolase [Nitriliruptor sp.]|uniref:glycoside hydrolase family 10 protein n=1 Tax=Nitriliruptor sp. TaxID=2448056 RepID=UPI0034A09934
MIRTRLTATALAALLAGSLALPAAAPPAHAATGSGACASHLVPATGFTDTLGTVHRAAIDCAVWWHLVSGRSTTRFVPATAVTRGQTAAMIARLLRTTGHAPAEPTSAGFEDTVGHTFEADIDVVASLGIVTGVTATRFAPDSSVTRAQLASVLARTFAYGYGEPLPSGPVDFQDVSADSPHRDAIGRVAAAGVTSGTSATRFSPSAAVPRAQVASFLTRATSVLLQRGDAHLPTTQPGSRDAYASRTRAAWVHLFDGSLKSRTAIQRTVAELAAADANVIYAQVARRHDAYYTSNVLPRTPDPGVAAGFDVLAELLTAAHARGIEVYAWYGVAPTYHDVYRDLDTPANWMYDRRGPYAPVADRWVTRSHSGTWSTYLDPGVPGVQSHVAAVVGEIARRYDVDGIHLDYVRYDGADQGYNPMALAAYRAQTGASGTPSPGDGAWTNWRREQTRQIILKARAAVGAARPGVPLSAAVITWGDGPATPDRAGFRGTLPYTRTLQDWDGWVRRGEIDAVVPMNYFRAHDAQHARWFSRWIAHERALASAYATEVVPGPAGYLNHPANVRSQVRAGMAADGTSVYSFQQPTLDGSRGIWSQLAGTRWGYAPTR